MSFYTQLIIAFFLIEISVMSGSLSAQDIPDIQSWPDLDEITEHFFSSYSTAELESDRLLKFSRNPEGWSVRVQNSDDNVIIVEEHLWSASKEQYFDISFFPEFDENVYNYRLETERSDILADRDYFDYNLFYGYPQWAQDVIRMLEPHFSQLTDPSMNHLARAYSNLANIKLSPGVKENGSYLKFDSTYSRADLDEKLIATYVSLSNKALEAYKVIRDRNPEFETFVGKIHTIYSNEHLTAFMGLALIDRMDLAKTFLADSLYTPFLLSIGKNLLQSCQQNSILVTEGDSDTFLLMYLQEKFGIRRDVSICNRSLMLWGRYINYFKNLVPEEKQIRNTLPMSAYTLQNNDLIILEENDKTVELELDKLLTSLAQPSDTFSRYERWNYVILPSKKFTMNIARESAGPKLQDVDSLWTSDKRGVSIVKKDNYIFRSELFIWDIISTNGLMRPVHFVSSSSNNLSLEGHLVNQGMVDTFFPFPINFIEEPSGDIAAMEFDFSEADVEPRQINFTYWMNWLKYSYYKAIDQAITHEDTARQSDLLSQVTSHLGNKYALHGAMDHYFAQVYINMGMKEEGINLLNAVFQDQCTKFDELDAGRTSINNDLQTSFELIKQAYLDLTEISDEETLKSEIKQRFEQIQARYESAESGG